MLTFRGAPSGKALEAWRDNFSLKVSATKIPALISKKYSKNVGLGFWMGFDIWLRLGKNAMKRGWEAGVRVLLGMKMRIPGSVGPGDRAKVELY